jgi:hypothetical protein
MLAVTLAELWPLAGQRIPERHSALHEDDGWVNWSVLATRFTDLGNEFQTSLRGLLADRSLTAVVQRLRRRSGGQQRAIHFPQGPARAGQSYNG